MTVTPPGFVPTGTSPGPLPPAALAPPPLVAGPPPLPPEVHPSAKPMKIQEKLGQNDDFRAFMVWPQGTYLRNAQTVQSVPNPLSQTLARPRAIDAVTRLVQV